MSKTWVFVIIILLILMGAWEGFWRFRGFIPAIEDDRKLWHLIRSRIDENTQAVIIGASRIQLGVHPDTFFKETGIRPLILAIDGNPPFSVMKNLAEDPLFKGTLFCAVHPRWLAEPPPEKDRAAKWVRKYTPPSMLSRIEMQLSLFIQKNFVFRYPGLSLSKLKQRFEQGRWPQPAYSAIRPDRYREAHFTAKNTPKIYESRVNKVRAFTSKSKALGPQAFMERIHQIDSYAKTIQSRGGRVIFIRMPSSGGVRELEARTWPRERYWNLFAQHVTGKTIHFEDYETLSGFHCPDGSHLGVEDAKRFTEQLLRLLNQDSLIFKQS